MVAVILTPNLLRAGSNGFSKQVGPSAAFVLTKPLRAASSGDVMAGT